MHNRIKEVRKKAKLTQEAFGKKIGVTQNYIWMLETGQRAPSERAIRDICREFGVNELWLRTGAGDPDQKKDREDEMASFRSALVTTLLRFDPDGPEWEILERIYNGIANARGPTSQAKDE